MAFYDMIWDLFEEQEEDDDSVIAWRKETLGTSQVFGTVPEKSDDESDSQIKATTLQLLREQRAKKKAAAAEAASLASAAEAPEVVATTEPEAAAPPDTAVTPSTAGAEASTTPVTPTDPSTTSSQLVNATSDSNPRRGDAPSSVDNGLFFTSMRPTPPPSSPPANFSRSSTRQPLSPARVHNVPPEPHNSPSGRLSKLIRKLDKKAEKKKKDGSSGHAHR